MKSISNIVGPSCRMLAEGVEERINTDSVLKMLYSRYAEEVLQWYHYYVVSKFMMGRERPSVEKSFAAMAEDELGDHAEKLLKRIAELGGDIETVKDINSLTALSECRYAIPTKPYDTRQLVTMNIEHERCAIKGYEDLCDLTRGKDTTTYEMAAAILADEEEHLQELKDYLADIEANNIM